VVDTTPRSAGAGHAGRPAPELRRAGALAAWTLATARGRPERQRRGRRRNASPTGCIRPVHHRKRRRRALVRRRDDRDSRAHVYHVRRAESTVGARQRATHIVADRQAVTRRHRPSVAVSDVTSSSAATLRHAHAPPCVAAQLDFLRRLEIVAAIALRVFACVSAGARSRITATTSSRVGYAGMNVHDEFSNDLSGASTASTGRTTATKRTAEADRSRSTTDVSDLHALLLDRLQTRRSGNVLLDRTRRATMAVWLAHRSRRHEIADNTTRIQSRRGVGRDRARRDRARARACGRSPGSGRARLDATAAGRYTAGTLQVAQDSLSRRLWTDDSGDCGRFRRTHRRHMLSYATPRDRVADSGKLATIEALRGRSALPRAGYRFVRWAS